MAEKLTSEVVGRNVARLRAATNTTIRELAAGLKEQELPMSSSGITDIERGRRQVNVDQLTALAAALGVSPMTLLMPLPDDGNPDAEVMLSGTSPETAHDMDLWLRAEQPLTAYLMDDWEQEGFRRAANPPWAWKKGEKG
ncbi:helix-turn-helix domain-containing protein [Mycobacteroides abscessus]|uniref:helix-turn-helix domain-containing protein n=1 Tax=Mycobacteroides abscessus TaxID=36809 RepID=UPI002649C450|nr:helix-turn-helix transcriptional regulator [Mycobacteroides abscessus]MDO3357772.1 helix-turn-helix transcriptional regulator [Mycobacteroides abscessus subsp. massiliense]WKE45657.1 helix-turn-helix transcriptional regulator [Mycobacteroides abscessus subsp. massiliense]